IQRTRIVQTRLGYRFPLFEKTDFQQTFSSFIFLICKGTSRAWRQGFKINPLPVRTGASKHLKFGDLSVALFKDTPTETIVNRPVLSAAVSELGMDSADRRCDGAGLTGVYEAMQVRLYFCLCARTSRAGCWNAAWKN